MKKAKRILVLLFAMLVTLSLCPTVLAAGSYEDGQYFEADFNLTHVNTVQVSATGNYDGAVIRRTQMLNAGYDSFIYLYDGMYRVMCGKFREYEDAAAYSESIHTNTDRDGAYVTNAYLPEAAIREFEDIYYNSHMERDAWSDVNSGWETPSGLYFEENAANTILVYTVQFSMGSSFQGAENNRDDMIAQGYSAFVYKGADLKYRIMTGAFATRKEAEAYCEEIRRNTDQTDAVVTSAYLPASMLQSGPSAVDFSSYSAQSSTLTQAEHAGNPGTSGANVPDISGGNGDEAQPSTKLYIPVVEQALAQGGKYDPLYDTYGMLYDMDSDGMDELIIMYGVAYPASGDPEPIDYRYSVYDIENNSLIARKEAEWLVSMLDWWDACVGLVEYNGQLAFMSYAYQPPRTEYTLYDVNSWNIVASFNAYVHYSRETYQINGRSGTEEEFKSAISGIEYIDLLGLLGKPSTSMKDIWNRYRISGMTLPELLEELKQVETAEKIIEPGENVSTEQFSVEMQKQIIEENRALWAFESYDSPWGYAFTDLDHNGRLEVLATSIQGSGMYTYAKLWEVNESGDGIENCSDHIWANEWSGIVKNALPCYYDKASDCYYYICEGTTRDGVEHQDYTWSALCLKNGSAKWICLAKKTVDQDSFSQDRRVKYFDDKGNPISEQEYNNVVENFFVGMELSTLDLIWETQK